MKKFSILFVMGMFACTFNGFSQLRVDSNGNATVKYGNFSSGNDAIMYFGDTNHYIKSVWGWGVKIGTAGATDVIRIKQYDARVGINRDPSYILDVNGTIRANTTTYSSDERLKEDIKKLENSIFKIKQVEGFSYKLNNKEEEANENDTRFENNRNFGFMAQDFKDIYPELVYEDDQGYLSVDYVSMIPVLLEAIKEQQAQIDDFQNRIEKLESSEK